MATINQDRDILQLVDLLCVNVENEIIPRLDRIETMQISYGRELESQGQMLSSIQSDLQLIKRHLGIP